ncbi:MFS transporter [Curvibacter sp. RS43]|uniref:MFS transporter n=1 Tax=Curvibacter microcysteis TaxID=3026419 RepID=A0ABT5MEY7_9BURK|nr:MULTISPECIES: MFS transporter [unclassified Curvibacter]MDD0812340.1 MFS transporter [Curvibacter sp. RS43]MDD0813735.1 MFS transporter [Curvibacter sp. HBC28]
MHHPLPRGAAIVVFFSFACAYFLSALIRAVTATLSPLLTQEFALQARDLGLLAGGYFLGFAATQLPLGTWLDRHGPRKVILCFLAVAVLGCVAFSVATSFTALMAARVLCGVGVSACLMAPLTGFRRWLTPQAQLRANSWMLMTGSLGMVASTLPVQLLLPWVGWRPLFWGLAALTVLAMGLIAWRVPVWSRASVAADGEAEVAPGYAEVWRHPYFRRMVPIGFCSYGGMVAMQTLWAGPWMVRVAGYSPAEAATGLFAINLCMLCTFWAWGLLTPRLFARGWTVNRLITHGLPVSLGVMALIILLGEQAGAWAWALFCVTSTFVSLAQPAVAMAFPPALAGRALSAYNLVVFAGVFVVQWGIGLGVDLFGGLGWSSSASFRAAMGVFLLCSVLSYAYFRLAKSHNATRVPTP